ncbi:serine threonine protein partial : Serine/threonine protein kinase with PASTA sensor(S) (Fragment) OS=Rhodopirellula sallentina SM41 GN=RSSM_02570 PE=4 SV=1: Pkinase: LRR_6 [Gemmataceae bacterium]
MNGPHPDPDPTRTAAASSLSSATPTNLETVAPVQAAEPATAPAGQFGEYVLLGELGRGGMGAVYRAEDPRLKREVALKVMLPQFAANEQAKARFVREARAQAKVEHDHVAAILHIGDHQGLPFIVMPLLKGVTLHAALRANPRPPLAEVIRIGREIAEGLAAAHEKGLVHRDIKPANVWLEGKKLRVKILDFGLARVADGDGADATDGPVTREGAVVGTPAYMSPEQGRGLPVDGRTDLFSLGVVLYQMTTGELPFRGANTLAILTALAIDHPPPPIACNPAVPQHLSDFVMRLLAKDPAYRPPTAEAAAEGLRAIEAGLVNAVRVVPLDAPPPIVLYQDGPDPFADLDATEANSVPSAAAGEDDVPVATPARPPRRGGFSVWALVGGVLLAVAGVIGFVATQMGKKPPEPEVAKEEPRPAGSGGSPGKRTLPNPVQHARDRAAVEAVLANAVVTVVLPSRQAQTCRPGDRLPDGPFELTSIAPAGDATPPDFAARTLAALAGQTSFTAFLDPFQRTEWSQAEFERLAGHPCAATLTEFRTGLHVTPKTADTLERFPTLIGLGLLAGGADDAVLVGLRRALQRQQYLVVRDLGQSGRVTGAGWAAVAGPACTELVLVRPRGLGREACEAIARMPNLRGLTIEDGGELTAAALEALAKCPRLRDLNLTRTVVAAGAARHFAGFRSLSSLLCNLCGPGLADEDVPHLAALKALRSVGLNGTGVTDAGGKALAAALPRCAVEAGEKSFEPTDAHFREANRLVRSPNRKATVKLANGTRVEATKPDDLPDDPFTLVGVELSGGTPEEVKRLAAIPTLESFTEAGGAITAESLRALVPSKETLTQFYSGSEMTDDDLRVVGQFARLKSVHATGPRVTDVGAGHLAGLKELYSVALPNSAVTAAGVRRLATLPALAGLVAFDSALGDDAVEALAALKGLTLLNVTRTRVTAAGHGRLRRALPDCKIEWEEPERWVAKYLLGPPALGVTVRTAAGKEVDVLRPEDLPAEPFTLVRVSRGPGATRLTDEKLRRLEATPTLVGIDAPGAPITPAGLRSLRASRGTLRDLYLNGVVVTDEMCAELAELTALVGLNFEREGQTVTDAGLAHLARLPKLDNLWVGGSQVTDAGLKALAGMPRLRSLSLYGTGVSDAGVAALAEIPALGEVILTGTRVTAAGAERLRKALPRCKVEWEDPNRTVAAWALRAGGAAGLSTPRGFVQVGPGGPLPDGPFAIKGLDLGGLRPVADADVRRVAALPDLDTLVLSGTSVTDAGVAHLAALPRLDALYLANLPVTDAGLRPLKKFSLLKLHLGGTKVTDASVPLLAGFDKLDELNLFGTAVTDDGLRGLGTPAALRKLVLTGTGATDPGVAKLRAALPKCSVVWEPAKTP